MASTRRGRRRRMLHHVLRAVHTVVTPERTLNYMGSKPQVSQPQAPSLGGRRSVDVRLLRELREESISLSLTT